MVDESEALIAALQRAAAIDGRSLSSLKERILRDWLVAHGFLDLPRVNTAGEAALLSDRGEAGVTP